MGIMGSFLVSNFSLETVNEYSKTGLLAISFQQKLLGLQKPS
jgi:hypothetical protein